MASFAEKRALADVLSTVARGQREVEIVKQVLAEIEVFEPLSLFKHLDTLNSTRLIPSNLLEFLKKHYIPINDREVRALLREMGGSDALLYREFMNWILPEDTALRKAALEREGFVELPYEVEYGFVRVLEKELACARAIEVARQTLHGQLNSSVNELFRAVDTVEFSYIGLESLREFFGQVGVPVHDENLHMIVKRLDKDLDGKISYTEFIEAVTPTEPFYKLGSQRNDVVSDELKWKLSTDPYKPYLSMRVPAHPSPVSQTFTTKPTISRVTGKLTGPITSEPTPWTVKLTQFRNQTLKQ